MKKTPSVMPGAFSIVFQSEQLHVLDLVVASVPVHTVTDKLVFVVARSKGNLDNPKSRLLVLLEHVGIDSPVVERTGNRDGCCKRAIGNEFDSDLLRGSSLRSLCSSLLCRSLGDLHFGLRGFGFSSLSRLFSLRSRLLGRSLLGFCGGFSAAGFAAAFVATFFTGFATTVLEFLDIIISSYFLVPKI